MVESQVEEHPRFHHVQDLRRGIRPDARRSRGVGAESELPAKQVVGLWEWRCCAFDGNMQCAMPPGLPHHVNWIDHMPRCSQVEGDTKWASQRFGMTLVRWSM